MGPTHPPQSPPTTTTSPGGTIGGGNKQPPTQQKLRLMISYGGHILPRPHDKALFYAGGETRIISATRTTVLSLSSLFTHLSKSLFNNGPHPHNFLLKYQLPHHDLDSLISISSDEDLFNMVDEYDRLGPTGRIRFFVFMKDDGGGGVDDDWFIDALKVTGSNLISNNNNNGGGGHGGDDGGLPETIMLESSSSFGSTNSSNSPGNINNNKGGDDFKVVLPSVDSLGSDTSIPSPNFSQQAIVYQDAAGFVESKVAVNLVDIESSASDRSPQSDIVTPVQVSGYMIPKPPTDQPQYPSPSPHPPAHYIYHPSPTSQSNYVAQYYPSSIPVAYTPMYQTYVQPQQHFQYQLNKPYPVYMMPVGQTQNLYDNSSMHCLPTTPTVSSSQPQVASNPIVVASPMVYEGYKPTTSGLEYAAKVHGQTSVATQPETLPPPVNQTAQPVSAPLVENTNYISDYEDPMHAQIYKTQPSGATLSSQLQMLPESFAQLQVENAKH